MTVRRALVFVAVVAVLLVGLDQWARARVESAMEDVLASRFAASTADVDVDGPVMLLQLLEGRLERARVRLDDLVAGDPPVRVQWAEGDIGAVEAELPPPAGFEAVTAGEVDLRALVQERELTRLLAQTRPGWRVDVEVDGVVVTDGSESPLRVQATPRIEGAEIVFQADGVEGAQGPAQARAAAAGLRVPAPVLADGLHLDEVSTTGEGLVFVVRSRGAIRLG